MDDVKLTRHSINRTKERLGISKKLAEKNARKALEYGVTHAEATGKLRRYFDKLYLSRMNANNIRIYNRHVYLFAGNTLITVLNLPQEFYAAAEKIQKRRQQ